MTNPRRVRLSAMVSGLALVATAGLVTSSPAQAEPDIDDVQSRVDTLFHEAEQAQERYHDAKIELDELQDDLDSLEADQRAAQTSLDGVRTDARESILRQYTGGGDDLGAVTEVVTAGDAGAFLDRLSTMSSYQDLQDGVFDDYATGLEALDIRRDAVQKRVDQVAEIEADLAADKEVVDDKLADAEALLDRLKEEEREAILSRGSDRVPSDVPVSGRATAAVNYAMAQVGDSYVYGAAGPSAFDCSGLTMMAWAQAGVGLPHSSSAQYSSGAKVAVSDLQAGDLVFYYSPISHVGMYIGNGMIVHAANPGAGVKISPLNEMPYVGAVRPG
ncbi:C40 family peptidase [Nocardioides dongxiaopingii]|uniref:C40 family peptidase n=1 Tax=Nocardioides dongxiaopingii TaxID=2576036 RepID=UPI001FE3F4B4|nr:C40 family peptidase [Nocardioides dongxiaopingii]